MDRAWSSWIPRTFKEFDSISGVVSVLGIIFSIAIFYATESVIAIIIPLAITLIIILYCVFKAFPERYIEPEAMIGINIYDFCMLDQITPRLPRIGFLGQSNVGKSTIIKNIFAESHSSDRTDRSYARVAQLPGTPKTLVIFLDGAGQQYSQQFTICENSDIVVILLDHNAMDGCAAVDGDRLNKQEQFLEQLHWHFKKMGRIPDRIHFLLNKRDCWKEADETERDTLRFWFSEQVLRWNPNINASITSSIHSNFYSQDMTSLVSLLRSSV